MNRYRDDDRFKEKEKDTTLKIKSLSVDSLTVKKVIFLESKQAGHFDFKIGMTQNKK